MLAVFREAVAKTPEELANDNAGGANCSRPKKSDKDLIDYFVSNNPQAMCLTLAGDGVMAYTHHRQPLLMPRSFGVVDDVFCVFIGTVENLPSLRQEYGLTKTVNEVMIAIEAYKALRDRGPFPADQVLQDFEGHFAFVLYDSTSKTLLATRDADGKAPLFWGQTADGSLAFSDEEEALKDGCGISFGPFPQGCFFSPSKGLQSYQHPLHKMKAVPWVDATGQLCGVKFVVDSAMKEGIHHVSSAANWTQDL
uniref:DUF3700 domain-containing protein n=1 Tax=Araucaria cunninghamii TaxID=56994 RepID=A0A0D6QXI6_ARACU